MINYCLFHLRICLLLNKASGPDIIQTSQKRYSAHQIANTRRTVKQPFKKEIQEPSAKSGVYLINNKNTEVIEFAENCYYGIIRERCY